MIIALYFIIFVMGTFFGTFSAQAIYSIPLKKNIAKERAFCPKCKHQLSFFDSIPVFSYILLRGKCRYCGKKIENNFIVELLMGLTSVGIFISLNVTIENMSILTLIEYLYLMIFVTTLVIIAGIDKKNKRIYKPIIFLGCVVACAYIIFLYMRQSIGIFSIYKYVIYFIVICMLSAITSKYRYFKYSYLLEIMMICIYINMFIVSELFLITAVITMISLIISIIIKKYKLKVDNSDILAEKEINLDIPIGMYLCISNIIAMLIQGIEIFNII